MHPNPDPRKLQALTEFVAELGFQTGSLESRFELQKLLGSIHGRPEEHAVNYAVLRSLQRAVYSPRTRGTTLWPAIAIATSLRRSAAIPI